MQTQLVLMLQLYVSPHLTHITCFMLQKFQTTLPLKHISYLRGFTAGAAVLVDPSSEVQQSFAELSQVFKKNETLNRKSFQGSQHLPFHWLAIRSQCPAHRPGPHYKGKKNNSMSIKGSLQATILSLHTSRGLHNQVRDCHNVAPLITVH